MRRARSAAWAVLGITLAVALVLGGVVLWSQYNKAPLPLADRCVATAGGRSTTVDPQQARYAAIISGMAVKRGLVPRAASIALATAYQESGIRNLDYGHADSIGLFQQRPSKGWGTVAQIMDPWYSSRQFYRTMERVEDWQTRDINDVAQAVQRSAYPEAYRRHVPNARTLASSLTGQSPASFSCMVRRPGAGDPEGLAGFLTKTLGGAVADVRTEGNRLVVTTRHADAAWAVAHQAIANTNAYGLLSARVGAWAWTHDPTSLAQWQGAGPTGTTEVALVVSPASR